MSVYLPNGSTIALGTTVASPVTVSGVSNANPGLATATAHGFVDNDIVIVSSGWSRASDRVFKVDQQAADTFLLLGLNTTNTDLFPASTGGGTASKVTAWTQVAQVLDSQSQGGEQQFTEYQFLEGDSQVRIPTFKSAYGMNVELADDQTLAGHVAALAANDDRQPRAVRIVLPGGKTIFFYAYVSISKVPTLSVNQVATVSMTLSMLNEPTRYSA